MKILNKTNAPARTSGKKVPNKTTVTIFSSINHHRKSSSMKVILLSITFLAGLTGALMVFSGHAAAASVKDFGAMGDGVTDDTAAIQKALDTNTGTIDVPAGRYIITKALFMRSDVSLVGVPRQSVIVQGSTSPEWTLRAHIVLGNGHPYAYDKRNPVNETFPNYPVSTTSWEAGAQTINLSSSSDARKLKAGETICVRSSKEFPQANNWAQPDYAQFVRIKSIQGSKLNLYDSALNSIQNPQVCKITGSDPYLSYLYGKSIPWYPVQNSAVRSIDFENGSTVFDRGMCYACTITDVQVRNTTSPLMFNALVKSTVENVDADFWERAIEVKMSSSQTTFRNITLKSKHQQNAPRQLPYAYPIDIGERSVSIMLDGLHINAGSDWTAQQRLIDYGDAQKITLQNSDIFVAGGGVEDVIGIRGNTDGPAGSTFQTHTIKYINNTFDVQIEKARLVRMLGSAGSPISNVEFSGNTWSGIPTTWGVAYWAEDQVKSWSVTNDTIPLANRMLVSGSSEEPVMSGVVFQ